MGAAAYPSSRVWARPFAPEPQNSGAFERVHSKSDWFSARDSSGDQSLLSPSWRILNYSNACTQSAGWPPCEGDLPIFGVNELPSRIAIAGSGLAKLGVMVRQADERLAAIELLTFDIDGTLTDATTWWAGEEAGWTQRYSVRDGEALRRLIAAGLVVVPLSRNGTMAARRRMEHLRCAIDWLGVDDKLAALEQIRARHPVALERILHIGDGPEDVDVFEQVGVGVAVADAHPWTLERATLVLRSAGGARAIEELEGLLAQAGHPRVRRRS